MATLVEIEKSSASSKPFFFLSGKDIWGKQATDE